ncbi:MAG: hypothetical protein QOI63_828 [Thermoplasmata archaeon]|nr:hypothetical protein [Thermoplasmata archaeon]
MLIVAVFTLGTPPAQATCLGQFCLQPAIAVDSGEGHACAILSDGSVTCWGDNTYGQSAGYMGSPPATAVSGGSVHTCALLSDGSVTCWGDNSYGQSAGYAGSPLATAVSAGGYHTCALLSDGSITCWGDNDQGQSAGYMGSPPATAVSGGTTHTCALLSSGAVTCWGDNDQGQSAGYTGSPPATVVTAGMLHTCALLSGGAVTCWGDNTTGQSAGYAGSPPATAVTAGGFHTCALLSSGAVTCWGYGGSGQLAGYSPLLSNPQVPTGVVSCVVYNSKYIPVPYPNQNQGIVIEYDPPGPVGDVAFCAGTVTGAPCDTGQSGVIVNNAPTCLLPVCPQGVNPNTVSSCGIGPVCPTGITNPPGPNQVAVVCGTGVSACSFGAPGPGWTVGGNGVCLGLPWVVPGAASMCPASATMNARIYWGTTPGFAPGSTFDVCL